MFTIIYLKIIFLIYVNCCFSVWLLFHMLPHLFNRQYETICRRPNSKKIVWYFVVWIDTPRFSFEKSSQKYFSSIATIVSSDRLFLKLGHIYTAQQNRLKPRHANELLFLNLADENHWNLENDICL